MYTPLVTHSGFQNSCCSQVWIIVKMNNGSEIVKVTDECRLTISSCNLMFLTQFHIFVKGNVVCIHFLKALLDIKPIE